MNTSNNVFPVIVCIIKTSIIILKNLLNII